MLTIKKVFTLVAIVTAFSSCYVTRAYKYRKFELNALKDMDTALLKASSQPFHFNYSSRNNATFDQYLDSNLTNSHTYAFLVIKDDTIRYERYFGQVDTATLLPSFSVAKSFVSTLVAIAHEEGKIKSLDEPITNYLPQLLKCDKRFEQITIQHVLDMRSGIKSNESYSNPFSDVLKLGFTKNISKKMKRLKIEEEPGKKFEYKSVNTQILGMLVEAATGEKLQTYLQRKLWQPLGMETDATWNVDNKRKQSVRAFCCLNATPKDFAKLGRLFLNKGNWNEQQLVSEKWVNNTTNADTLFKYSGYKNQWWAGYSNKTFTDSLQAVEYLQQNPCYKKIHVHNDTLKSKTFYTVTCINKAYHAEGILGQYIYVHPNKNLIIVRLGHYWYNPKYNLEQFIYGIGDAVE